MPTDQRTTPETDAAYFRKGVTLYDLAGEMKRIERERDEARDEIEVHKAFGKVAIAERNLAWHREDKLKAQRDELLEALERLSRVAAVELNTSRPDVIEQVRAVISAVKGPTP